MSASEKLRPLREEISDLPNLITLVRIGFIPFVLIWIRQLQPWLLGPRLPVLHGGSGQ